MIGYLCAIILVIGILFFLFVYINRVRYQELERWEQQKAWNGRQEKLNTKYEQQLAKHEAEIRKLKHAIAKTNSDIEHWKSQLGNLYALLDVAQDELEQSIVGGKNQSKYQKQVMTYTNQIHAAENKLKDAKFAKEELKRKLEVA